MASLKERGREVLEELRLEILLLQPRGIWGTGKRPGARSVRVSGGSGVGYSGHTSFGWSAGFLKLVVGCRV